MLLFSIACNRAPANTSILEADERIPQDEGTVTEIGVDRVQLDGERAYRIADELESFTTRGKQVTPLPHHKGRFVHIGLDSERLVVWIASIGIVNPEDKTVIYSGRFERMSEGRAIFADGTALRFARGVSPPPRGRESVVRIDTTRRVVVEVLEGSASSPRPTTPVRTPSPTAASSPSPTDVPASRYP